MNARAKSTLASYFGLTVKVVITMDSCSLILYHGRKFVGNGRTSLLDRIRRRLAKVGNSGRGTCAFPSQSSSGASVIGAVLEPLYQDIIAQRWATVLEWRPWVFRGRPNDQISCHPR